MSARNLFDLWWFYVWTSQFDDPVAKLVTLASGIVACGIVALILYPFRRPL